ncbi:endolytic transglycosylase MltG [Allocoprobacillus halotolerans]|uniref:Endolytic murein transglycosylase n=1 Tax=Allocoprobacillus halotolerans TaxID=2944914 RepID=A0ABY5I2C4_9FIRM|nr:endolytic transglycosylase MltG [Allocoprobacillus halotolerans]UTY39200.1 endolytic transglycosylase MltG [Allocoprobacillus halotolerans]
MKNKKIIVIISGIIVVLIVGMIIFYNVGISATSSKDEEVIVTIEQGSTASQMLDTLDEAGLVKNKLCGQIFLKLNHYDNLQANTYVLNKNMSLSQIFSVIEDPDIQYILLSKLTIKEGTTIPEVAKEFAGILDISADEVIKQWDDQDYLQSLIDEYWFMDESILDKDILYPLEGYLYPETYYITEQEPDLKSMTKLALDMMDERLSAYQEDIEKMGWTPHQFLTFASVVERESLYDEDRPKIAGVFMNRLNKDMLLQSDITVNYAWQRTGVDVSVAHTQIDSRYNTYKYTGLPIGPISTVSKVTIEACINYVHHDDYYFFAKEDGTVIYSHTYKEHQKAVEENRWY